MEGKTENERRLTVPGEMEGKTGRIQTLSDIQNDSRIKGVIDTLNEWRIDGRKEAEKAVNYILSENENIDQTSDLFFKKLWSLLSGVVNGTPIPKYHIVSSNGNLKSDEDDGGCEKETITREDASVNCKPQNKETDQAQSDESNKEKSYEEENGRFQPGDNHLGEKANTSEKDFYTINHSVKEHGLAFILSYTEFDSVNKMILDSRPGAMIDKNNMKNILEDYGFKVMTFPNREHKNTSDFLEEVVQMWNDKKYDILIGIISSHGEESVKAKVKSDKKEVKQGFFCEDGSLIYTGDLVGRFCGPKPKLFFIQACRSRFDEDAKDKGVSVEVTDTFASDNNHQQNRGKDTADARPQPTQQKPTGMEPPVNVPNATQQKHDEHSYQQLTQNEPDPSGSNMALNSLITDRDKESADCRAIFQTVHQESTEAESHNIITSDRDTVQSHCGEINSNLASSKHPTYTEGKGQSSVLPYDVENKAEDESQITNQIEDSQKTVVDHLVNNTANPSDSSTTEPPLYEVTPPPCTMDSLVMFSSAPGKEAYSSSEKGGWLLHLVEKALQFQKKNGEIELLQLLTAFVSNEMASWETNSEKRENTGLKCVPCICHKLRKDIYLKPLP